MRPNYHPEGVFGENKVKSNEGSMPITQLWHLNGKCPKDTIPIRRTMKEDVLRASSVKTFGKKKYSASAIPQPRSADPDLINQRGHQVIPTNQGRSTDIHDFVQKLKHRIFFAYITYFLDPCSDTVFKILGHLLKL